MRKPLAPEKAAKLIRTIDEDDNRDEREAGKALSASTPTPLDAAEDESPQTPLRELDHGGSS